MVEIAHPGEYAGSRFDWTAFIRQVTLKQGLHTFCTAESLVSGKGTGGIGLCNEFGNDLPVGYDEAPSGSKYPKIGVGLLTRRDSGRYDFIAQPGRAVSGAHGSQGGYRHFHVGAHGDEWIRGQPREDHFAHWE
jgi:hypothetical protein